MPDFPIDPELRIRASPPIVLRRLPASVALPPLESEKPKSVLEFRGARACDPSDGCRKPRAPRRERARAIQRAGVECSCGLETRAQEIAHEPENTSIAEPAAEPAAAPDDADGVLVDWVPAALVESTSTANNELPRHQLTPATGGQIHRGRR
jgi:hypothetical protein